MYLHAYQSYLWNAAASHRVSAFPHDRPVAGDLVLPPPPTAGAASEAVVAAGEAAAAEGDVAAAVEEGLAAAEGDDDPAAAAAALDISDEGGGSRPCDSKKRRSVGSVHVVTEAEAEAGTFSMDDVVLPLPGNSVQYPRHATAQVWVGAQAGGWCLSTALLGVCCALCSRRSLGGPLLLSAVAELLPLHF